MEEIIQPTDISNAIQNLGEHGARALIRANIIPGGRRVGNSLTVPKKNFIDFLMQNKTTLLTKFGESLMESAGTTII